MQDEKTSTNRTIWIALGGVFVLGLAAMCFVVTVGLFFLTRDNGEGPNITSREPTILEGPTILQQVATPTPPQPAVSAGAGEMDYETAVLTAIYENVVQSVVNVDVLTYGRNLQQPFPDLEGLDPDQLIPQGQGSGFVWDTEGHIVTNAHVVEDADQVQITFHDGTATVAEVIGVDPHSDLAVLKIDPVGYDLRPVRLGNLDEIKVGMRVAAIGNPFGFQGTMTSGIVSAIGRSIPALTSFSIPEAIQTDAPINPGNSGGPLLNERGEVIGVNAQIRTSTAGSNSGVGFAIPVTIVQRVIPVLIAEGSYEHAYIGVSGNTYSPICADILGLPADVRGAYVNMVLPDTPAARAGLRGADREVDSNLMGVCPSEAGGDLIIAIDGRPVTKFDDLLVYLERYTQPGDTIVLTVLRDGRELDIEVRLAARPDSVEP